MKIKSEYMDILSTDGELSLEQSFSIAQFCSNGLASEVESEEVEARDLVIRTLEVWAKIPKSTHELWLCIIEGAGLYPYLTRGELTSITVPTSLAISYECHKSKHLKDTYLHEEQLKVSRKLLKGGSVVLSAPTSFGKSLLIEEIIASKRYRNIVVIQPTLALLDETRKKLSKYSTDYRLVVSTSQRFDEKGGNVFLFTGERVVEYKEWPKVDFFVIDEFYKLSLQRDDERAVVLNQALHKLLSMTKAFYMLGPSVDSVSKSFSKNVDFQWEKSHFATVALDDIQLEVDEDIGKDDKIEQLFSLLSELREPTLVYCSSPPKATSLSVAYLHWLRKNKRLERITTDADTIALADWVRRNIHPNWSLASTLERRIGYHHGSLPRHVGSSLVDLFNEGKIRTLLCTSTLIEGVNTAAKNVILYDSYKGNRKPIDFFDYRNIAGRSGRMLKYYTGRLYRFDATPAQFELDVDIPLYSQDYAPVELLIHLKDSEIKDEYKDRLDFLANVDGDLVDIMRSNGLNIEGQLKLVRELESNSSSYNRLLSWTKYPTYDEILAVIELGWKFLLRKGESKGNARGPRQLAVLTRQYITHKALGPVVRVGEASKFWQSVEPDDDDRREAVIGTVLGVARHWFDYKLPKWLGTISNLQEYVFSNANLPYGDYTLTASHLEHGFLPSNLAILLEYDIPASTIKKLANRIPSSVSLEDVLRYLHKIDIDSLNLHEYEKRRLKEALR